MRKNKRVLAFVLVFVLIGSLILKPVQLQAESMMHLQEEVYIYPVTPEDAEWSDLGTIEEKIEACEIPQSILENLTTEALVRTVLDYPLIVYIYAYDTTQKGYDKVKSYFNGLQELESRVDAIDVLQSYIENQEGNSVVDRCIAEVIFENLNGTPLMGDVVSFGVYAATHYDYTPNGTRIPLVYNMTYEDHGLTEALAVAINADYSARHPGAVSYRNINPAYNCHSYAWYSTSQYNKYWLNGTNVTSYITDGSYRQVSSPQIGDVVLYENGDHSGIYSGNGYVMSKWGVCKLYEHSLTDCPYTTSGITYWRRN